MWRVSRPGPPGYHPSFGLPKDFGASPAEAQSLHSARAVAQAETLIAPGDPLEDAAVFAVERLETHASEAVRAFWASELASFRATSQWLRPLTRRWLAAAPTHVQSVLAAASTNGVHVALFDWASRAASVPRADALTAHWRSGFPLIGDVPVDPIATPHRVKDAVLSEADLLAEAPARSSILAARARANAARSEFGDADSSEIWASTLDEVRAGRISEPVPWADSDQTLPVCRRFGVRQATSTGKVKLRVIDDFAENAVNDATGVSARIRMASTAGLRALARRLHKRDPGAPLLLLKADFKSAYRCAPISGPHLPFARLLLVRPDDAALFTATQWAMPFGAVGAVYAWDRIGSAVTQILARLFWLPLLRYVDDLFTVVPSDLAADAFRVLHEVVGLLGLTLDPAKSPPASLSSSILGISVECLPGSLRFSVEAAKLAFWGAELDALIAHPCMRPLVKLTGRLSFGCFAVWGPGPAAYLVAFYAVLRMGLPREPQRLLRFLEVLRWWRAFLSAAQGASVRYALAPAAAPPAILYTDAEGSGGLGACLFSEGRWEWWQAPVPASVGTVAPGLGYPAGLPIFLLEAAVPYLAFRVWHDVLRGRRVLVFIDNQTFLGALRKGRSTRSPPLNHLVHAIRRLEFRMGLTVTLFWVPSRFNIADPASRGSPPPGMPPARAPPSPPQWRGLRACLVESLPATQS